MPRFYFHTRRGQKVAAVASNRIPLHRRGNESGERPEGEGGPEALGKLMSSRGDGVQSRTPIHT